MIEDVDSAYADPTRSATLDISMFPTNEFTAKCVAGDKPVIHEEYAK